MAYTKTNWQDEITPLSAANMNKIEQGIADAHAALDARKLITYTSLADIGLTSASFDGLTTEEQFFDTVIPKMADGSLLILVIEGNNSPINNVGRFLPGTGGSGSINGILEIVKGNNNRTSVTYQFATTSALGGAHATRYEGTFVHGNVEPNRRWSGWAKVWNSATFDPDAKFDKAGGTITGNVIIDNAQLQFRDGTTTRKVIETWGGDSTGLGVALGGGGGTIIAGGEADTLIKANNGPTNEHVYIGADQNIYFYSNLQNDWNSRREMIWRNNGNLEISGNVVHHAGNSPTAFVIPIFIGSPYAFFNIVTGDSSSFSFGLNFPSVAESLHTATYAITWDPSFARGRNLQYEVSMWVSAGTGRFRLYWSGGETSMVTTSSTTPVRLRSGNISLPNGVPIYFAAGNTESGSTVYIAYIRLIIS